MRFRDILSVVTGPVDEHVISFAEQLAGQYAARLSTLVVNWKPHFPVMMDPWIAEPTLGDLMSAAEKRLAGAVADVLARLERNEDMPRPASMLLAVEEARAMIGARSHFHDITVVGRPTKKNAEGAHALLEGPLLNSGRPVLVVPPDWRKRDIGRRVLVCWKPTREAARAVADADDFIVNAASVTIVTVDAQPSETGYGPSPGADIAAHFTLRGATVDIVNADSLGRSETRAMLDQALAMDADLIVMGAYGHSRTGELIFGGVTHDMLAESPVPLFLAH